MKAVLTKKEIFSKNTLPKLAFAAVVLGVVVGVAMLALGSNVSGYPLETGENIASWNFASSYPAGSEDEKRVLKEIDVLKAQYDKSPSKYELEVGIANEYMVLGRGKDAYQAVSKAIELNPNKGLAYFTLGHLMEQLGAPQTAKKAYDLAVTKEPSNTDFRAYRDAYVAHLTGAK